MMHNEVQKNSINKILNKQMSFKNNILHHYNLGNNN